MRYKLFHSASIYTLGNILNAAIPFALMPILTRYLTPEDYGITAMLSLLVGIITPFVTLNMSGAITVDYFKMKYDIGRLICSSCFLIFILSFVAYGVLSFFSNWVNFLTAFPSYYLWSVIVLCGTNYFFLLLQSLYRVLDKPIRCITVQILQTTTNLAVSIYMVVWMGMDWHGRVDAQIINGVIWSIISLLIIVKMGYMGRGVDKYAIRYLLKFGVPLIPHALSVYFILAADRVFLTQFCGIAEVGIFSIGYQMGMAIELLTASFNNAFSPWLYKNLVDIQEKTKVKIVRFTYIYGGMLLFLAIIYSIVMPWFLSFFIGDKFQSAYIYVLGFALASVFKGMYYMVVNYIFFTGKTSKLAMITCCSGLMHILITYWFIKNVGAVGVSYAAVFTNFIMFILTWMWSAHIYKMPWFSLVKILGRT